MRKIYINENALGTVIKAPVITINEFKNLVLKIGDLNEIFWSCNSDIEFDPENLVFNDVELSEDGIPFVFGNGGSDGGIGCYFAIYHDGNSFKLYYPEVGNTIN